MVQLGEGLRPLVWPSAAQLIEVVEGETEAAQVPAKLGPRFLRRRFKLTCFRLAVGMVVRIFLSSTEQKVS